MKKPEKIDNYKSLYTDKEIQRNEGRNQVIDEYDAFLPNFDELEKLVVNITGDDKFHRAHNIAKVISKRLGR